MVARLLATGGSSLGSNPDISQKYEMGDISKGVASPAHYSPSKKYAKMSILLHIVTLLMVVKIQKDYRT